MKKKIAIAALALSSLTSQAATVLGSVSCVDWNHEKHELVKVKHELHAMWLMGYLSGANLRAPVDFLAGNEARALIIWVDNYCAANPLDNAYAGAEQLIKTLIARKGY